MMCVVCVHVWCIYIYVCVCLVRLLRCVYDIKFIYTVYIYVCAHDCDVCNLCVVCVCMWSMLCICVNCVFVCV